MSHPRFPLLFLFYYELAYIVVIVLAYSRQGGHIFYALSRATSPDEPELIHVNNFSVKIARRFPSALGCML